MTKSTITRERVVALIAEHSYDSALVDALEHLLAAMDSEPVAEVYQAPNVGICATLGPSIRMLYPLEPGTKLYRYAQPAPVVMDDEKLRALFDAWFASDCSFDQSPEASEADNIAWRESYWYVWQRCRAAMFQAGNSPGIGIDPASGPDHTVEVRYVAPPGYVMVPKEATEKMLIAGLEEANPLGGLIDWDASRGDCNTREQVQEIFKAMLAAAPQEVKGD